MDVEVFVHHQYGKGRPQIPSFRRLLGCSPHVTLYFVHVTRTVESASHAVREKLAAPVWTPGDSTFYRPCLFEGVQLAAYSAHDRRDLLAETLANYRHNVYFHVQARRVLPLSMYGLIDAVCRRYFSRTDPHQTSS
ncbi:hypothetical protein J6590_059955 [Homalodisca vitripennis]|nr:hypothetical protein J6590_059955 [Homalodisca vitripennis]